MPTGANPPYRAGPRDHRYIAGLREVLRDPGSAPRTRLAQLTGIARNKLASFERHPGRMAWVREQLAADRDDEWERLVTLAYHRAMAGDVKRALFYAQAIGKFGLPFDRVATNAAGPGARDHHDAHPETGTAASGTCWQCIRNTWSRAGHERRRAGSDPPAGRRVCRAQCWWCSARQRAHSGFEQWADRRPRDTCSSGRHRQRVSCLGANQHALARCSPPTCPRASPSEHVFSVQLRA